MSEAHDVPAPPRRPKLRAVLRHRWALGLVGGVVAITSAAALIALAAAGIDILPFADQALDASGARAFGDVTAVRPTGVHQGRQRFDRVDYRFEPHDGPPIAGSMLAPRGAYRSGDRATIEFLPDRPEVNRLAGERRSASGWVSLLIGLLLLPAVVCLLVWLRGVMRARILLRDGRLATAAIVARRVTRFVNPPQIKVAFEFDDAAGRTQRGDHWVFRRSALGRALEGGATEALAIVDDGAPEHSRLVTAEDFA